MNQIISSTQIIGRINIDVGNIIDIVLKKIKDNDNNFNEALSPETIQIITPLALTLAQYIQTNVTSVKDSLTYINPESHVNDKVTGLIQIVKTPNQTVRGLLVYILNNFGLGINGGNVLTDYRNRLLNIGDYAPNQFGNPFDKDIKYLLSIGKR
jgi:hypothetical protein